MRCVIHDYSGHPFQVHLSRHLARRGHTVHHLYYADHPGPKGLFEHRPGDPASLVFEGVSLGGPLTHAAGTGDMGLGRIFRELAYGRAAGAAIARIKPDIVLCGNTPADAQRAIMRSCRQHDIRFVYWLQDIYSIAVTTLLTKKFGLLGKMVGQYYKLLDRKQFRSSDGVVAISEDFGPMIKRWVGETAVTVVENWAAIDDLPVCDRDNEWSRAHKLDTGFVYLYCGTLGRKHNPMALAKLAQQCRVGDSVVAVSQGYGVPILTAMKETECLHGLKLLPLQPAKQLANVLATANVLLATIEAEAGTFAVPSKVLSYLCAARPILLAADKNNLAARTVIRANAGIVVDPADESGFLAAAEQLRRNPALAAELGANGRAYADQTFDLGAITDKFEAMLLPMCRQVPPRHMGHAMSELVTSK